jgi:hypothetical protein
MLYRRFSGTSEPACLKKRQHFYECFSPIFTSQSSLYYCCSRRCLRRSLHKTNGNLIVLLLFGRKHCESFFFGQFYISDFSLITIQKSWNVLWGLGYRNKPTIEHNGQLQSSNNTIYVYVRQGIQFNYTVRDKIETTEGFELSVFLVILAIFSQYFT